MTFSAVEPRPRTYGTRKRRIDVLLSLDRSIALLLAISGLSGARGRTARDDRCIASAHGARAVHRPGNFVRRRRATLSSSTACGARCAGTCAVVLSELAIALPIALLLNASFRGRGVRAQPLMVPYITPPAVRGAGVLLHRRRQFRRAQRRSDARRRASTSYVSWLGDPTGELLGRRLGDGLVRPAVDGAHPARGPADHPGEFYEAAGWTAPVRCACSGASPCRTWCQP